MKPSKTAAKKPAKRKNSPMVQKLLELKYRINEAYRGETVIDSNREDKSFVMGLINNIRNDASPTSKIQMIECNRLWKKYS